VISVLKTFDRIFIKSQDWEITPAWFWIYLGCLLLLSGAWLVAEKHWFQPMLNRLFPKQTGL
jgi:hypothetical protein